MWTLRHRDISAQGNFGLGDVSAHGCFGRVDVSAHGCFGTVDVSACGHFGTVDIFGMWTFWHRGHFGPGIFQYWTFRHGFFQPISDWEFFDVDVLARGHFGTVDISARGFFGTGCFRTGFVITFQFRNFLTWEFRQGGHFGTGIFRHWMFRHRFFQHISVGEFFDISKFLTFKNFGTLDIIKGFTAQWLVPVVGRVKLITLYHMKA